MSEKSLNFIEEIIEADIAAGRIVVGQPAGSSSQPSGPKTVHTRFPPEPNGYLHIGHGKSIRLNSSLAEKYGGRFNLRFDDTNPVKEEQEYVDSIIKDVQWLGADFRGEVLYASDYFEQMYAWAVELVKKGLAYVCDLSAEETRQHRGTLTTPGRDSPFRSRSVAENLDLLARMRAGEFPDGSKTLRAKIDMGSPNLNLRDPVMYRVLHAHHHRQGDAWCIYPMYDWAHGLEDSIEGITHSICTLEFEDHRPLYDWFLNNLDGVHHPRQIEFARGNLTYTVMSKRKLIDLVKGNHVKGWDDPRMPTLAGYRRRGYTPQSIRDFWDAVGVAKFNALSDVARLEAAVRDHLNKAAPRRMCVLRPLKLTIANWGDGGDAGRVEMLPAINNPEDASAGSRAVPFSRELYVERDDFMLDPPKKFFRLAPGAEVRLRYGYWVRCTDVIKDAAGNATELICTYDPATKGGDSPPDGRKVKGTIHWVSARHAVRAEVRLFDRLFMVEQPDRAPKDLDEAALANWSFLSHLNPNSLEVIPHAMLEPNWKQDKDPAWPDAIARYQFERLGYFCLDPDSTPDLPVFNRTVTLADTWAKIAAKQ